MIRALGKAAAAVMALLACATGEARAQHIDELLAPGSTGMGTEPGVTVETRVRPEYEMQGLRLGGFTVKSDLDETLGYASDVTGAPPARGSPLIETFVNLQAASNWTHDSLGASLNVDHLAYTAQPRQSLTNWSAALGGSYDIGRDALELSASHRSLSQTPAGLDVPLLDRAIAYRVNDARFGYVATFNHVSLRPAVELTGYDYDNGTVLGVPYLQSFRDHVVVSPSLEARYEVDPLRSIVLLLRDSTASYRQPMPGSPTLDFNDTSVLGGFAYAIGLLQMRLLGGYETRHYRSGILKTVSAPVIEAAAVYTPSGLTTVTLDAARSIQDSAAEASIGYTETALTLRVDHEYLKNVLLSARAGAFLDQFQADQGRQSLYTVGVGATWLLSRHLRLALGYDFSARRGSAVTAAPESGPYSEHRVLLQVKVGL